MYSDSLIRIQLRYSFTYLFESKLILPKQYYMDLKLSICGDNIITDLFEKKLILYLYIPSHSTHAPGVLTGLVIVCCYRIYTMFYETSMIHKKFQKIYEQLTLIVYKPYQMKPLLHTAI